MPKTVLPNARVSPRFAGISTFCRYPRLEDVAPENRPLDWALYGVPFDGGVTYRPGARFGPRAIRDASQYVKRYHLTHDIDICDTLSLADAGDSPVAPYSCEANTHAQRDFAAPLADATTRLFAVGGDHTIALGNILATHQRYGTARPLALVHFDSHLDTVDQVWGEKFGHASVFRRAIELGAVDPARMISIGVKGPLNSKDDLTFARDQGITLITQDRFEREGPAAIAAFLKRIGDAPTYFTFDIDCVDPAFAPGTGTLCPGGFTSAEVFSAIRRFAGLNLVGADLVEVLPDRDPAGITSFLAAHVIFEILALSALTRRSRVASG